MPSRLRPIPGTTGLSVEPRDGEERFVVVADVHLGLGSGPIAPRGPPGASSAELAERAIRVCETARAHRLVIAGDVKHPIVGVPPWLRPVVFDFFGALLEAGLAVEVVLGNHDVGLVPQLPREVTVHPSTGVAVGPVGVFHGHRWPAAPVLGATTLVAGHLHPGLRFAPTASAPDGKVRAWLRVEYDARRPVRGPDGRPTATRELVIVPAFHPLAGTEALNRDRPERGRSFLYARFLAPGSARAYLLDGTDVGAVPTPLRVPRPGSPRGERSPPRPAGRSSSPSRRGPALRPAERRGRRRRK